MRLNTYKEEKTWKEIQSYLPEENRLNDDTIPEEMYMKIEECDVHIDRYVMSFQVGQKYHWNS